MEMRFLSMIIAFAAPLTASAACGPDQLCVSGGVGGLSIGKMLSNLADILMITAPFAFGAIFITGAFFYVISIGDDQRKGLGKGMMIGAVMGVAIVAGARIIMNTVLYFVS